MGGIYIYFYASTLQFQKFVAHTKKIETFKLLANGDLASSSDQNDVKIHTNTCSLLQTYSVHTAIVYGLEQIDSDTMASGSADGLIHIWSISTGARLRFLNNNSPNVRVLKKLSSGLLASGIDSSSNNILIWNPITGSLVNTLNAHTGGVLCLEVLDSQYFASGSVDSTVIIWDLTGSGTTKFILKSHLTDVVALSRVSSCRLASGSKDGVIIVWDWTNGQLVHTLVGHTNAMSLDYYNEDILVSGSLDKTLIIWNLTSGSLIQNYAINLEITALVLTNTRKCYA